MTGVEVRAEGSGDARIEQHVQVRISGRGSEVIGHLPAVGRTLGRAAELRTVREQLTRRNPAAGPLVVHGPAGAGKTHLVHAAAQGIRREERQGRRFSGEIEIRIDNRTPEQYPPARALRRVVDILAHALDTEVPARLSAEAAQDRYRAWLADYSRRHGGRPVLILVDGATDAGQVRPLLPPDGAGVLVVTSRTRLAGITPPPALVEAGPLAAPDAVALLAAVLDTASPGWERRVARDPESALRVADLCDRLPLALTLAGRALVSAERLTVRELARRLADSPRRAAELDDGAPGIRAALDVSRRLLTAEDRSVLELLDCHPGPFLHVDGVAALLGTEAEQAAGVLRRLHEVRLLEDAGTFRHAYRMPGLIRQFVAERAAGLSQDRRDRALARLLRSYAETARVADRALHRAPPTTDGVPPGAGEVLDSPERALAWLDAERPNLVAAVPPGLDHPDGAVRHDAIRLTRALTAFLDLRGHQEDWILTHRAAARRAARDGHGADAAVLWRELGRVLHRQGDLGATLECYRKASAAGTAGASEQARLYALLTLACTEAYGRSESERWDEGEPAALPTTAAQLPDDRGRAAVLFLAGLVEGRAGRIAQGLEQLATAERLFREQDDTHGLARCSLAIGRYRLAQGNLAGARSAFQQAYQAASSGDPLARGMARYNLAVLDIRSRRVRQAYLSLAEAAGLFASLGSREGERLAERTAELEQLLGGVWGRRKRLRAAEPLPVLYTWVLLPPLAAGAAALRGALDAWSAPADDWATAHALLPTWAGEPAGEVEVGDTAARGPAMGLSLSGPEPEPELFEPEPSAPAPFRAVRFARAEDRGAGESATEESGSWSGYDSGSSYDSDREDSSTSSDSAYGSSYGSSGDSVAADDDYWR
ncbi:tetratricopeptide repeat protein [Streptomyces ginkgonis]|uniref:tetratricopeptide repeat protein n=1 Tax=Streptomyces ginkgonis TaxID=1812259 RepID=UPI002176A7D3|nr:tetratricopeptide repeat protein [Streptomyces ginkgonis]